MKWVFKHQDMQTCCLKLKNEFFLLDVVGGNRQLQVGDNLNNLIWRHTPIGHTILGPAPIKIIKS